MDPACCDVKETAEYHHMCPQDPKHPKPFGREFRQCHDETLYRKKENEEHGYHTTNNEHDIRNRNSDQKGNKERPFRPTADIPRLRTHSCPFRKCFWSFPLLLVHLTLRFSCERSAKNTASRQLQPERVKENETLMVRIQ